MSGVFRNIDPPPPPPHLPTSVYPCLWCGGGVEDTIAGGEVVGGGVNSGGDARHCFVLYICKYFVFEGLDFISWGENSTFSSSIYHDICTTSLSFMVARGK
jgi:hypothetical protein